MKAYFAGGCFWCITPIYKIYGVEKVTCGYSGGGEKDPSYKDVKAQKTGHRETIELVYDPGTVSYGLLLDIFLANVDPFDGGGQYIDRGFSYSPAVYYQSEEEKTAAEQKLALLEAQTGRKAAVAVEPFKSFYRAEEEHQDYYLKNPDAFARELLESGRVKNEEDRGKGLV